MDAPPTAPDEPLDFTLPRADHCDIKVRDLLEFASGLDWIEEYENRSNQDSSVLAMLYGVGHADMMSFVASHDSRDPPGASIHDRHQDTAYVVICRDGANGANVRAAHTPDHLRYIETVLGDLNVAGPLYDDSGTKVVGSMYCLHTKSLVRAREIVENDPYYKAGAFASVEYFPHLPAAGKYIGGTIW